MNNDYIKNNINFKGNIQTSAQKLPELHKAYNHFVQEVNKSDFCNSVRRYLTELDYIAQLKILYNDKKRPDLIQELADREALILRKLEKDFGITIE